MILNYLISVGTHWCYEVVEMLRNNSSEYHDKVQPLIEVSPIAKLKKVSDGIYTSHLALRHMPKDFMTRKCKVIHIYRNPKDVCVSFFNFIKETKAGELMKNMEFDVFFDMFVTGQRKMTFYNYISNVFASNISASCSDSYMLINIIQLWIMRAWILMKIKLGNS